MRLPPLVRLAADMVSWRQLLLNRFTLVIVLILLTSGSVVAYVGANDGGVLEGHVVDSDGDPVSNATVTLRKIPLQGVVKTETTTTNADGEFIFGNQTRLLEYQLRVSVNGTEVATRHGNLYFRGQNKRIVVEIDRSDSTT
jgi:5-hydroxyisourate hydrolase-like protein (transthyretin family)